MKHSKISITVLLPAVLLPAVLLLHCALAQRDDCPLSPLRKDSILTPTTMIQSVNMSCEVNAVAAVNISEQIVWEWVRLNPDDNSIEERIVDGVVSEREISVYVLQVQCKSSGFYQALYYSFSNNNTCLFSCFFVIEVEETGLDALRMDFERYPIVNGTVPSVPSGPSAIGRPLPFGTLQSVGTCGGKFYLASMCVVDVEVAWYRNGTMFDPRAESSQYTLSSTGELRIRRLTEMTVGYYVCVTTVNGLGKYQTVDVNIVLALPTTSPLPSPATTPLMTTTDETLIATNNLIATLKAWEFGLIIGVASLVIIMVLLSGAVWMGRMTAKRRKDNSRRRSTGTVQYIRNSAQRPKSMIEEIMLMEEAGEEAVDSGVSSSPVEIMFNCILFEELLHKGTFKVVHHGVVNQPAQGMLGIPVAIKRLKDEKSELGYEELMNEALFLRTFQEKADSHPSIVSLLGLTTRGGPTCLLLEYIPNETLDEFLLALRMGPIPDWYVKFVRNTLRGAYHKHISGDLMSIVVQVAEGMKYLTDHGFIHRDLSTRNILMGERLNVKITNPGMHHEGYYYVVSEREHFLQDMAPECLWEKRYSICSDVWSFGILIYRTVTLNAIPFPNMKVDELHGRMVGGERPQLLASFSNELYFLLQRCWQFVATERPTFSTIYNDLSHMAEKPTRHIILKATKDHTKLGHISENGQVFLRALLPHALDEEEPPQKKYRGSSGTMRSLISSIDDTIYTRETASTVLDFPSENENESYNNYERYLKGDLPVSHSARLANRRSYDETDTSGNDINPRTKERVKSTSRKTSKPQHEENAENADAVSAGKASGTSSLKKKKRRPPTSANSREKMKKPSVGITNKVFVSMDNNNSGSDHGVTDSGDLSTDGAPPTTEEDDKEGVVSDLSGSDNMGGSQSELVRL